VAAWFALCGAYHLVGDVRWNHRFWLAYPSFELGIRMSDATSIFGHYETRAELVNDVRLSLLAIVKETGEPTAREIAELVTDLVIIPLIMEFHE
jgi:hypothetical protein